MGEIQNIKNNKNKFLFLYAEKIKKNIEQCKKE